MILTCSACQTQYVLPENAVGPKGRTVKCANCGYSWRQNPITVTEIDLTVPPASDVPQTPLQEEQQIPSLSEEDNLADSTASLAQKLRWQNAIPAAAEHINPSQKKTLLTQTLIWFLLFLTITAITLAYMRPTLVRMWPASALLYEALGFPAPAAGAGIRFGDETSASYDPQAMPSRLHVTGQFNNTESRAVRLPILQARLFDNKGQWLKDWSIPLGNVTYMAGKQNLAFDYTLPQVPLEAYSLTFRFTDE
jgi:predicted Zn finger-like uncharacterized protein